MNSFCTLDVRKIEMTQKRRDIWKSNSEMRCFTNAASFGEFCEPGGGFGTDTISMKLQTTLTSLENAKQIKRQTKKLKNEAKNDSRRSNVVCPETEKQCDVVGRS